MESGAGPGQSINQSDGPIDDEDEDENDNGRRRKIIIWFVLVFLLALFVVGGAAALGVDPLSIVSSGGTGELTVSVTDQNGEEIAGQEVTIIDPETEDTIATANTDDDGEVEVTLDQGEYTVVAGDSERDITLNEETEVDLSVNVAPPEPE